MQCSNSTALYNYKAVELVEAQEVLTLIFFCFAMQAEPASTLLYLYTRNYRIILPVLVSLQKQKLLKQFVDWLLQL